MGSPIWLYQLFYYLRNLYNQVYGTLLAEGKAMAARAKTASVKKAPRVSGYGSPLPRVVVGTGREVSALLSQTPTRRTLAVTFESERDLAAAEEVYRGVGEFLPQLIRDRRLDKLTKVVDALLPEMAPSRAAMVEA